VTSDGTFLLMIAAAKGNENIVECMVNNGRLEIDKTDKFGVNAFWIACFYSNVAIMHRLVLNGIDYKIKNQNGSNALHIAVKRGAADVVNELIKMDFPIDEPKNNGITALGIASYRGNVPMM
jgi:ankyrin repeat protein